jgi:Fe-S cluster assembly ATP-binding protein
MSLLSIQNLVVRIDNKKILNGLSLEINAGEVHTIMGPNGSGKSTLSKVIAGDPRYIVESGKVIFDGKDLLAMEPEARSIAGVFLAYQYPVEIPGVNNSSFLRMAVNARRKAAGQDELDPYEFEVLLKERARLVQVPEEYFHRAVNHGLSGGEKKKNEMLQMAVLDPRVAILDETDSGLDIDALKIVAAGINRLRSPHKAVLMITHYQRLLNYVEPDRVHVLAGGRIIKSGTRELALELEARGYDWVLAEAAVAQINSVPAPAAGAAKR